MNFLALKQNSSDFSGTGSNKILNVHIGLWSTLRVGYIFIKYNNKIIAF